MKEAMKLALEALKMVDELCKGHGVDFKEYGLEFDRDIQVKYKDAIKALEEAQAKQEHGEPVAWIWRYANGEEEVVFVHPRHIDATHVDAPSTITPLYTTPPQHSAIARTAAEGEDTRRAWVGLTDRERQDIMIAHYASSSVLAQAIESKLKKKNKNA
jgi:hypothetical protein